MSLHESFFSYNIRRPYPFRWFTPAIIVGGIVAVVLVSFLNVAASGYELATISTTNPNKVRSGDEWFDSWPKWLASTRASCDPATMPLQTVLYTNNTLLSYTLASVWTYDESGSGIKRNLGSLVYDENPLQRCNVTSIQMNIESNDRSAVQVANSAVGAVLTANVECMFQRQGEPATFLELVTTFDPFPPPSSHTSFPPGTDSTRLALGNAMLMKYWTMMTQRYYAENVNLDTPFYKGEVMLSRTAGYRTSRPATMEQIVDMNFLRVEGCWLMPLNSTGISHATNYCGSHTLSELTQGQSPFPSIWEPLSWLGKALWFTVLADLGRDDDLLPNMLSHPDSLGNATDGAYLPAGIRDYGIPPSVLETTYMCQIPRLKSTGTLIMSVLVADLVLLQAIWTLFVLAVNYFLTATTKDEMRYCEGCTKDLKDDSKGEEEWIGEVKSVAV